MRSVGVGAESWRVRVDVMVSRDAPSWVSLATAALSKLVTGANDGTDVGADQGLGVGSQPVLGLLFWVRADDVGQAAVTAVDTALNVAKTLDRTAELYDVTIVPQRAVVLPGNPRYPAMPD